MITLERHTLAGLAAPVFASMIIAGCSAAPAAIQRAEGSDEMKAAIAAYVEEAAQKDIDINSIMVIQDGKVTGEAYVNGWVLHLICRRICHKGRKAVT